MSLIPIQERDAVDLCEFEASLVYIEHSSPVTVQFGLKKKSLYLCCWYSFVFVCGADESSQGLTHTR